MPKRSLTLVFVAACALALTYAALLPGPSHVEASHAQPCADLNGDGKVTLTDFKIVITYLGPVPPGHPADLDEDDVVTVSQDWIAVFDAFGTVTSCQDTPIGFGDTITPTPVATPVPAEISLNVKSAGAVCDTPPKPAKCTIAPDSTFTLSVSVNQAPAAGYTSIQTQIHYGSLTYKPTGDRWKEVTWPDTYFETARRLPDSPTGLEGLVSHAAISGVGFPLPVSSHTGSIVEIDLTCASGGSFVIALPAFSGANGFGTGLQDPLRRAYVAPQIVGQQNIDLDGDTTAELVDLAGTLDINCTGATSTPTATPTPTQAATPTPTSTPTRTSTPDPVGGVAELDDAAAAPLADGESSALSVGLIAAVASGAAVAIAGGAIWWARRRATQRRPIE